MDFKEFLEIVVNLLEIVVNITVIIAAVFAVIKFQIYEVLTPRYNTEIKVEQQYTKNDKIYLVCTYIIENTGEIPISLLNVSLNFYEAKEDIADGQIKCLEEGNSLPQRVFKASNSRYRDLMKISAGERSEFPIRGIFKKEREGQALFIYGSFKWKHKKKTFPYHKIVLIPTKESS